MKITELDETFPTPIDPGPDRSPGLHLTDIISDIEKELGKEYSDKWNKELLFEIGFMWEEVLSRAFADRMTIRPDELELDGIAMSPDGLDIGQWLVEEYKATYKSINKTTPDTVWRWMTQVKGYCMGVGRHPETGEYPSVVFRVLYLMGDWKGSGPQYRVYRVEFDEYEIEEAWSMIMCHARAKGWIPQF